MSIFRCERSRGRHRVYQWQSVSRLRLANGFLAEARAVDSSDLTMSSLNTSGEHIFLIVEVEELEGSSDSSDDLQSSTSSIMH